MNKRKKGVSRRLDGAVVAGGGPVVGETVHRLCKKRGQPEGSKERKGEGRTLTSFGSEGRRAVFSA
jgi:hypothetical protein